MIPYAGLKESVYKKFIKEIERIRSSQTGPFSKKFQNLGYEEKDAKAMVKAYNKIKKETDEFNLSTFILFKELLSKKLQISLAKEIVLNKNFRKKEIKQLQELIDFISENEPNFKAPDVNELIRISVKKYPNASLSKESYKAFFYDIDHYHKMNGISLLEAMKKRGYQRKRQKKIQHTIKEFRNQNKQFQIEHLLLCRICLTDETFCKIADELLDKEVCRETKENVVEELENILKKIDPEYEQKRSNRRARNRLYFAHKARMLL